MFSVPLEFGLVLAHSNIPATFRNELIINTEVNVHPAVEAIIAKKGLKINVKICCLGLVCDDISLFCVPLQAL